MASAIANVEPFREERCGTDPGAGLQARRSDRPNLARIRASSLVPGEDGQSCAFCSHRRAYRRSCGSVCSCTGCRDRPDTGRNPRRSHASRTRCHAGSAGGHASCQPGHGARSRFDPSGVSVPRVSTRSAGRGISGPARRFGRRSAEAVGAGDPGRRRRTGLEGAGAFHGRQRRRSEAKSESETDSLTTDGRFKDRRDPSSERPRSC